MGFKKIRELTADEKAEPKLIHIIGIAKAEIVVVQKDRKSVV